MGTRLVTLGLLDSGSNHSGVQSRHAIPFAARDEIMAPDPRGVFPGPVARSAGGAEGDRRIGGALGGSTGDDHRRSPALACACRPKIAMDISVITVKIVACAHNGKRTVDDDVAGSSGGQGCGCAGREAASSRCRPLMSERAATFELLRLGTPRARIVLLAVVLASTLTQLAGTIVNVALPSIGEDLDASLEQLQWVSNSFTLALAAFLLIGGSLGDRFGRRRVLLIGVVLFTFASAACAAAPTVEFLIAARALQGLAAALIAPGSLAILEAVFIASDREPAVGSWSGLGAVAAAVGPVVGGLLVQSGDAGWRVTFLLNVPLAVVVVFSARWIPETADPESSGLPDLWGSALVVTSLTALMVALTSGISGGWTAGVGSLGAVGLAFLFAFFWVDRRAAHPLVPPALFESRQFVAANVVTFIIYAAMGGALFLLPLQLQMVAGFSPALSGSALLPVTVLMLLFSARAGRLSQRIGPWLPMTFGPMVAGLGLVAMTRIGPGSSFVVDLVPAVTLFGAGLTLTVAPLTATALASAPERSVGVAAAVNSDVARLAGLFAVAVLPGLVGIDAAAFSDPGAFDQGFDRAVLACGIVCALGGAVSLLSIEPAWSEESSPRAVEAAVDAGKRPHTPDIIPTRPARHRVR